jgi:N6-L-threonylcarbamoyladenine synthase
MHVLGIESSCDETSAAIVKDGRRILSCVVSSSLNEHKKYGGVIPEIASRMQLESITRVTECAIKEAKIKPRQIGLVSVTNRPGLAGSLLVGLSFAKSFSFGLGVPLLGVNHLYSHIYANFLNGEQIKLPFLALIVSGGHTTLFYIEDFDKIMVLGQTCDDACGEAFDKVAKILGLGYPGGPLIERSARSGNPKKIKFNCSDTDRPLDFSFSGIKTAVLYYARKHSALSHGLVCDIAASFQKAAIDTLVNKSLLACKLKKVNRLVIGGGVAANNSLRKKFLDKAESEGLKVYFPAVKLCMDNAAMVAGLGYQLFKKGYKSDLALNIDLN